MITRRRIICRFVVVVCAGLVASCTVLAPKADYSRYYLLSPITTKSSPLPPPDPTLVLAVDLTDISDYLDRPQMVIRLTPNESRPDEFHRWLEPLRTSFSRVLGQDIALYSDSNHVASIPLPQGFGQDFEVSAKVDQFDGLPGGEVTLRVTWRISAPGGRTTYYGHTSTFTRQALATTDPVSGYVDALNALVGDLAREIVNALPRAYATKDALRSSSSKTTP